MDKEALANEKANKKEEDKELSAFQKEMNKMRAEMHAEMEKTLNDAKKSASEIIEDANRIKEQTLKGLEATSGINARADTEDQPEEMVSIKLFKDGDRYKDDLTVALNGRTYTIQRGKVVEVPKGVAEIIDASLQQDIDSALYREARADEFAKTL